MTRKSGAEARQAIIGAARRRFAATGLQGTTLSDIAKETGCSKAAVLYHFDSKGELIRELMAPLWLEMGCLADDLADLDDLTAQHVAVTRMTALAVAFRANLAMMRGEISIMLGAGAPPDVKRAADTIISALVRRSPEPQAPMVAVTVLSGLSGLCHEYQDTRPMIIRTVMAHVMQSVLTDYPPAESPGAKHLEY